ncbi:MAG TPA: LytR C-terminal domain-containing protein [Candidatus Woesebacteria bacterium]|jgi:hypothetical protein|nr:LytR C-terminal domain-containing protein [Candidatus Woesebacteria bacterium]HOC07829.1 LytR C-terminal domain-containing protein [Candidatus Woesebacteria bacterium]HOI05321.1 LytR C-terminal domain-containing protein [Candidatus Woesebacteria bacterium]
MRDYCPSRREQKKLKAKKVKARKVRRSKKKSAVVNWQKLSLFFLSLFLLLLLGLLFYYLLKNQLAKRHQLSRNQHLLVVDSKLPVAWVVFAPLEQKIKVFDFSQLSVANWPREEFAREMDANEEILFYSLLFNTFIDQVIAYPQQNLSKENQAQFSDFLMTELRSREEQNLLFYLEQSQVSWEWFNDTEAKTREDKENLLSSFLARNTEASYGKLFECPVAVINSSSVTGLASAFAQLLEKDGFSVIKRDSGQDILAETSLLIDPEITACEALLNRFQQLMPVKVINADHELAQQYRAGAVIFLAEDLAKLRIGTFDFLHDSL